MSKVQPGEGQLVKILGAVERRGCGSTPKVCDNSLISDGMTPKCVLVRHHGLIELQMVDEETQTSIEANAGWTIYCASDLPVIEVK